MLTSKVVAALSLYGAGSGDGNGTYSSSGVCDHARRREGRRGKRQREHRPEEQQQQQQRDLGKVQPGGLAVWDANTLCDKVRSITNEQKNQRKHNHVVDAAEAVLRGKIRSSLAGAALVFRFGKPSSRPMSRYEQETLKCALQNEDDDDDDDADVDNGKRNCESSVQLDPHSYFQSVGVHLKDEIIDSSLEQQVIERIIDILVDDYNSRSSRDKRISTTSTLIATSTSTMSTSSGAKPTVGQSQPFTCPDAVANRELYFVTTRSCQQMKDAMGRPFQPSCRSHFAWYVQNMDVGDSSSPIKVSLTRNSAIVRSGSAILPDVVDKPDHTQNLDNPCNKPFLDVLRIVEKNFGDEVLFTGCVNDAGKKERHRFKCLQLILAEQCEQKYAVGRRGLHQDKWSTAGGVIIGVTIGPGRRQMTMQHRSIQALYDLNPRSGYSLSGAARYGTLWSKRGLRSPIKHGLSAFAI